MIFLPISSELHWTFQTFFKLSNRKRYNDQTIYYVGILEKLLSTSTDKIGAKL